MQEQLTQADQRLEMSALHFLVLMDGCLLDALVLFSQNFTLISLSFFFAVFGIICSLWICLQVERCNNWPDFIG
jgi:hypothetical protein